MVPDADRHPNFNDAVPALARLAWTDPITALRKGMGIQRALLGIGWEGLRQHTALLRALASHCKTTLGGGR